MHRVHCNSMKKLIVILGPTAVGKTAYAISLAKSFGTEIISADSRQIFKELNIGAARPTEEELSQVPHHFIASATIQEEYSAGRYEREALDKLIHLFTRHDTVVCCGGSMLYINALLKGFDDLPSDKNIRNEWSKKFQSEGIETLQQELHRLDPEYYTQVDIHNPHRLIRALEVCTVAGVPYSSMRKAQDSQRDFVVEKIGIDIPREKLYTRINERVIRMMDLGLEEEARSLYRFKHLQALNTVGYKELFDYFDGQSSKKEAVDKIQQHTRNFAKRQLTWWRRDSQINWITPD
jgi:tRNA dimethylallyltransferase